MQQITNQQIKHLIKLNKMKLQLTRPICALDLETTGTKVDKDRIVEICIIKIHPNGQQDTLALFINPEQPMPAEATKTHHITDDMVKDKPTFKQVGSTIADFIEDCDFLGFNSNKFDIPLLNAEFERAGIPFDFSKAEFVDVSELYREHNPRTLIAAVKQYCNRDIENAHSAEADTVATIDLLDGLIDTHGDAVPLTVPELALKCNKGKKRLDLAGKFAYNDDDVVIYTFGKHKDVPVYKEKEYLKTTIMEWRDKVTGDYVFSADTRKIANELYVMLPPPMDKELLPPSAPSGHSGYYKNVGQVSNATGQVIKIDDTGKLGCNSSGEIVLLFGPNKNQLAKDNVSFVEWIVSSNKFTSEVTKICADLLRDIKGYSRQPK